MVCEVVGGFLANSLAIVTDAAHLVSFLFLFYESASSGDRFCLDAHLSLFSVYRRSTAIEADEFRLPPSRFVILILVL